MSAPDPDLAVAVALPPFRREGGEDRGIPLINQHAAETCLRSGGYWGPFRRSVGSSVSIHAPGITRMRQGQGCEPRSGGTTACGVRYHFWGGNRPGLRLTGPPKLFGYRVVHLLRDRTRGRGLDDARSVDFSDQGPHWRWGECAATLKLGCWLVLTPA